MNSFVRFAKIFRESFALRREVAKISFRDSRTGTVAINVVGCTLNDVSYEHYFGYLLACAGYQVKILMDDFTMPHWDYIQKSKGFRWHRNPRNRVLRTAYARLSDWIFAHPNVETIPFSKMLAAYPDDVELSEKDHNNARSSTARYFEGVPVDLSDPEHREYYELSLENCRITKKVGLYVAEKLKPDLFVTGHGFYSSWGPPYEVVKSRGIKTAVYELQDRATCLAIREVPFYFMTQSKSWQDFQKREFTAEQRNMVEELLAQRLQNKTLLTSRYDGTQNIEHVTLKPHAATAKFTYCMFTNILWDADLADNVTIFPGPLDWAIETIRFFEKHPEHHLLVRLHPREAGIPADRPKFEPQLRARIPHVDSIPNVTLIRPEVKVKSYDLARDYIDIGLVYQGMLGIELPYLGTPVISAARAFTGAGNTFEPKTRQEFYDLILSPERVLADFEKLSCRERALKFLYWYFFECSYAVPILKKTSTGLVEMTASASILDPVRNPESLRTLRHLLSLEGSA